jgi:hypothetical protein
MTNKDTKYKNGLIKKSTIVNIVIWFILTSISLGVYYSSPLFLLDENQILYLFSAASQVIAAIYGLIITGYIFLRNELDRKVDKDESYEQIVSILKADYFGTIKTISAVTLLSIALCFLVIVDATSLNNVALDILINISVSMILTELILIVSFVIQILNPKSLEIASERLRAKTIISETGEKGSIEDFLTNFNQIEYILAKYGTAITNPELFDYESVKKKRISNPKLVQILFNDERIDSSLKDDLLKLISFRNSIIHGTNLFISKQDVDLSKDILQRLKNSLGVR